MNKTQNFGMSLPDLSNNADINVLNENFNNIDRGLSPFYVATQEDTNIYKITTGLNKNSLNNGYCIRVAIPSDSTNNVSITVDNITCRVMKSNGSYAKNFKANAVYSLTYYNSVFILTSSGGGDDVNFTNDKLLEGYTANNSDGEKVTGTMKNNGDIETTLNAGGSFIIPQGYHGGQGKVIANSLPNQTVGNATSEQILQGYSAWANGKKIDGQIKIKETAAYTPTTSNQIINGGQYLEGPQTIVGDVNLIAENILEGKNIFGVVGSVNIKTMGGVLFQTGSVTGTTDKNGDLSINFSSVINIDVKLLITQPQGQSSQYIALYDLYSGYKIIPGNYNYDGLVGATNSRISTIDLKNIMVSSHYTLGDKTRWVLAPNTSYTIKFFAFG